MLPLLFLLNKTGTESIHLAVHPASCEEMQWLCNSQTAMLCHRPASAEFPGETPWLLTYTLSLEYGVASTLTEEVWQRILKDSSHSVMQRWSHIGSACPIFNLQRFVRNNKQHLCLWKVPFFQVGFIKDDMLISIKSSHRIFLLRW